MRKRALLGGVLLLAIAWAQPPAQRPSPTPLRLGDAPLSPRSVRYEVEARLWPERRVIKGRLRVKLRNTSRAPLQRACFHLYLNAFAGAGSTFMRESRGAMRFVRFDPRQPGGIVVSDLRQAGQSVPFRLAADGTVLELPLPRSVPVQKDLELELSFESRLPRVFERTGQTADFVMAGQWYPKPGVLLPDGSWHCPPFHARAEFFAEFASYEVKLQVPESYRVGSTGVLVGERSLPGLRELQLRAVDVHDFAWTAWPHFDRRTLLVDGVEVELLTVPGRGQAGRELRLVQEALPRLQRWLRPYPYRRLTVVDVPTSAVGAGGMEYPTLFTVWIPWWVPGWLHVLCDEMLVHELVHQYFQGMVASNEVVDPWLDEGVTTYVTGLLLDEMFGEGRSLLDLGQLRLGIRQKDQLRIAGPDGLVRPVGWPAPRFRSWQEYGRTVYARGALLLRTVESLIGLPAMRAALADYASAFAFRHPAPGDLERALLARAPATLRPLLRSLLEGTLREGRGLDYGVRCRPGEVELVQRGALALPLELEVRSDRAVQRFRLEGGSRRLAAPGLRSARLGPPGRLALDHTPADLACEVRVLPGGAASSWATFMQPLLQVLGP